MTKTQKARVSISVGYNNIKNAPAHRNLTEAITSAVIIIASLAYFAYKVARFTLQVIGYWLKALVFVLGFMAKIVDKLAPTSK